MDRRKAIVRATGEVVTLHLEEDVNGEIHYSILEDTERNFIPDEIRIIEDTWSFIQRWHPDYSHCDEVAYSDDLECCLEGKADKEKLERVKEMFGDTPEQWECAQIEIDAELLSVAVKNFLNYTYHREHYI